MSTARRAKVMATLGPASDTREVIGALMDAGVDLVRLNLSHGTHAEQRETIHRVRELARERQRHVAVLLDLMGPRYRVGDIGAGGMTLARGETIALGGTDGAPRRLPLARAEIVSYLEPGERVLIDGGMVELVVEERVADAAVARVVRGGTVTSHKGINLPETELPFEITEKDRGDIRFAIEMDVDFIGVSYVAAPADLAAVGDEVARAGGSIPLIAKIERAAAVAAIEQIVAASHAVMVARGDLGVEVPFERVPVIQKRILAAGRAAATPVIVATDMLASMITNAQPTRAEVSDVANAVFDGADVLMLSGETAIGAYPREAVEAMVRTIVEAERLEATPADVARLPTSSADPTRATDAPDALAAAAARAAQLLDVRRIVVFTQSGDTARLVARYRPTVPIAAFTVGDRVARQLQVVWGVSPGLVGAPASHEAAVQLIDRELLRQGERPGSLVILLMGAPIEERPRTNLLRIHRIGEP